MKKYKGLLIALCMVLLISGCGTGEGSGNGSGPIEIEMVHWANSLPHKNALQRIADNYNASQDEVVVTVTLIAADSYRSWLLTQLAGGIAPEMYMTNTGWADADAKNGYVLELTQFLNEKSKYTDDLWINNFEEGYMRVAQDSENSGHWNSIPTSTVSTRVYYNKEMFDAYNVPHPYDGWTWEEFISACQTFEDNGIVALPVPNSAMADYNVGWSFDLMNEHILSDRYKEIDVDDVVGIQMREMVRALDLGLIDYTDPQFKESFRIIKEWSQYWTPGFNALSVSESHDMFLRQDSPMLFNGSWTLKGTEMCLAGDVEGVSFEPFDYGIVSFPELTGQTSEYVDESVDFPELGGPAFAFAVPATVIDSGKMEATIDFYQYFTAPENFKILAEEAYDIPIIKNIEIDEKIKGFLPKGPVVTGRLFGDGLNSTTLADYVFKMTQLYLDNQMELDQLAQEIQNEYVKYANIIKENNDWNESNNWGMD